MIFAKTRAFCSGTAFNCKAHLVLFPKTPLPAKSAQTERTFRQGFLSQDRHELELVTD
jgi:hypothetical protein